MSLLARTDLLVLRALGAESACRFVWSEAVTPKAAPPRAIWLPGNTGNLSASGLALLLLPLKSLATVTQTPTDLVALDTSRFYFLIHTKLDSRGKRSRVGPRIGLLLYQVHCRVSFAVEAAAVAAEPVNFVHLLAVPGPAGSARPPGCCRAAPAQRRLSAWTKGLWGSRCSLRDSAGPRQLKTWSSGDLRWESPALLG